MTDEKKEDKVKQIGYDPAEFRVSAKDTKGHDERYQGKTQTCIVMLFIDILNILKH